MKRVKVVFIVAMALFVLGGASSALAASFTFSDDNGHWWTGKGEVTATLSFGSLPEVTFSSSTASGTGTVNGSLNTDWSWTSWPYYTLGATASGGPEIGVDFNVVDLGNDHYVAWSLSSYSLMLFAGDTSSGYAYFGIDFGDKGDMREFLGLDKLWDISSIKWENLFCGGTWQNTFTLTADAKVIYGKNCNPTVPIPGAAWLLGSGLIGLVGFKKRFRKS